MENREYGVGQKRKVLAAIFNNILEKANKKSAEMLTNIFDKNAIEQSYFSAVGHKFIFEGVIYTNPENKKYSLKKENIQIVSLDENIVNDMKAYIQTKIQLDEDSGIVGAYLTRVLNEGRSVYDIYALLPEKLHKHIVPEMEHITPADIAECMTLYPERVMAFKEENAIYEGIALSINVKLLLLP